MILSPEGKSPVEKEILSRLVIYNDISFFIFFVRRLLEPTDLLSFSNE